MPAAAAAVAAHRASQASLALAALILLVLWVISLALWPYAKCGRCKGSGTNAGSNSRRWGTCGRCGGSGKRLRFGARLIRRDL